MTTFRIFISSPSDVFAERERAERVVQRLAGELGDAVRLEVLRWEHGFYTAARTFQDQITRPADCDVVICILWKRLGADLPPDYRRPDGSLPTGTEYEFEDAMEAGRRHGKPDLLVYRKTAPVLLDAERVEAERAQFERLKRFWETWFQDAHGHFTAAYHSFETTDAFEAAVEAHLRQWLARRQALDAEAVPWPVALRGSPFRGLQAFDAAQAPVFFGRRRATERMRERLAQAAAGGLPFLAILGQSGAGKSSIARAGLLPRLTQPGAVPGIDLWRSAVLRPSEGGADAVGGLCAALYRAGALPELAEGDSPAPADLARLFAADPEAAARAVARAVARAAAAGTAAAGIDRTLTARLLLVVDQLEEALALPPPARLAFARALRALAEHGAVWIVATLRSDFYAAFQAVPDLVALKEAGAQVDLLAPTPAEVAEIIAGPAQAAGLRFERRDGLGLDDALLEAAAAPGSLPLLQLALDALFEARDAATGTLTWAAHDGFGGLQGVVERRAEATLAALDAPAQAALPGVLAALVAIGEDGLVSSRAAPRAQAARDAAAGRLVDAFIAARLMVSDADARAEAALVRVAHEALIAAWPRARAAIAADQAFLAARFRVEAAERAWTRGGRQDDDLLPPGRKLAEAAELADQRPDLLSPDVAAFVAASREAEVRRVAAERARAELQLRLEREAAQAQADAATRVVRRTRAAVAVVSVMLVAALGAAGYAVVQRRAALARTAEAERNFGLALDAGNTVVSAVFDHMRSGGLRAATARELLDSAARTFGSLAAIADTPALARRQVQLLSTMCDARRLLGDSGGALDAAQQGVALARRMLAARPDAPEWQRAVAVGLEKAGTVLVQQGRIDEGLAAFRESVETAQKLVDRAPDDADYLRTLGISRDGLAGVLRKRHDLAGALALYRQTLRVSERAAAARPDDLGVQRDLAVALENVADVLTDLGQHEEALRDYRRDLDIATRALARQPDNADWQLNAAIGHERVGDALLARGDFDGAAAEFSADAALSDALVTRDADNTEWQDDAANARAHLGRARLAQGRPADALTELRRAEGIYRALLARDSANDLWRDQLALTQVNEATALRSTGDIAGALAMLEAAVAARDAIAARDPDNARLQRDTLLARDALIGLLILSGKAVDAVAPANILRDTARKLAVAAPGDTQLQLLHAMAETRLGDVLNMAQDRDGSAAAYADAAAAIEALAATHPDDLIIRRQLALSRRNLADVAQHAGDAATALARLEAVLPMFRALADAAPADPTAQVDLTLTYTRIAMADETLGRSDAARAALKEAQQVLDAAQRHAPNDQGLATQLRLLARLRALAELRARVTPQPPAAPPQATQPEAAEPAPQAPPAPPAARPGNDGAG